MKVKVIGLKRFEGVVDGKSIVSGKLFCEVKLDDSRNGEKQSAKGFAAEELRVSADIVKRLEHLPLPFMADAETERVSNGKEAREVVIDVRPLDVVRPAAQPKAAA